MTRYWKQVVAFSLISALAILSMTSTAKEIEPLADEWTRIGENDTIPAGMHVRIDMTTGEKWVKQIDKDEEEQQTAMAAVAVQPSGETTPVERAPKEQPAYDYDRMYETLAQLPPEEHERMGGLPELPSADSKIDPQQAAVARKHFEARMKEIWEQRQAELRKIQEEQMVDLPEILKTNIGYLRNYVNGEGDRTANQIHEDLTELEFLLTDVDMARDFYTLQGWPWLLTLLVQRNETTVVSKDAQAIQAAAAWVVGTAVQNTGEFHAWVVEPIMLADGTVTTALDALTEVWNNQIPTDRDILLPMLPQKVLYALSACLRGNPLAQRVFDQKKQPDRLVQALRDTSADTAHGRKQILRILQLGHDLLVEWDHALSDETLDDSSVAVVKGFRQDWITPSWCQVVSDKSHIVSQLDKRLPLVQAWWDDCQESWDSVRINEMLKTDGDDDLDADTNTLHQLLSQKASERENVHR